MGLLSHHSHRYISVVFKWFCRAAVVKMEMARNVPITILFYIAWQVLFAVMVSPLVLRILTAEQMGFMIETALLGLATGIIVAFVLGFVSARTEIGLNMYWRAFRNVKTRRDFEEIWKIQQYGSYDGVIAETHWSGTVLPLVITGLSIVGLSSPLNIIIAVFIRWSLHLGVHAILPERANNETAVGTLDFVAIGLLFMDVVSSICFLATKSIVAPVIVHTFASSFSQILGSKRRIASRLDLPLE